MKKSVSVKTLILIVIAVVVIAVGGIGIFLYLNKGDSAGLDKQAEGSTSMLMTDESVQQGNFNGKSLEELLAEMQEKVDNSSIVVDYMDSFVFPDGTSEAEVGISNPVENIHPMQFVITLDETQEEVYASGLVPIGSYISKIKLSKDLDAGSYPATLFYKAYDEEKQEIVSAIGVTITLVVKA